MHAMKWNKSTQKGCILNDSNYKHPGKCTSGHAFTVLRWSSYSKILCSTYSSPLSSLLASPLLLPLPPLPSLWPPPLPSIWPLLLPHPLSLQTQATTDLTAFLVWPFPDFFPFILTCLRQDTLQRKDICDSWWRGGYGPHLVWPSWQSSKVTGSRVPAGMCEHLSACFLSPLLSRPCSQSHQDPV